MGSRVSGGKTRADEITQPDESPTLIDLFAGCGGGSLGFMRVGFRPVGAVEIDEDASDAYEANVGLRPLVRDIRDVTGQELLTTASLEPGRCTLLFGCPPCQSFTILRRADRAKSLDRRRNLLYVDYLRLAGEIRPRHIALENVPGMSTPRWRKHLDALLQGLSNLGYEHSWDLLDAADFGVPQRRQRILVVASRVATPILPTPTHGQHSHEACVPHVTVRDAIGSLSPLESGETDPLDPYHRARRHKPLALRRLRAIPEGGARSDLPSRLRLECHKDHKGHYDIYGRMWWDRPAPTLTSGCTNVTRGRFAHPAQNRAITLREAMLLQSFPYGAVLKGTGDIKALQVGNALPPRLAEQIGACILAMDKAASISQPVRPPATSRTRTPIRSRAHKSSARSAT